MKILITGGHGQLGRELFQEGQTRNFDVLAPSHHQMDITDIKAVKNFIDLHQPSCVINAAAYTQVDKAESEESLAFAVNKTGCTNLAQICAKNEIPLFQVSTDYVFDGQKNTPYHESDPISPIGVYGRSKAAGETEIRSNLKGAYYPSYFLALWCPWPKFCKNHAETGRDKRKYPGSVRSIWFPYQCW